MVQVRDRRGSTVAGARRTPERLGMGDDMKRMAKGFQTMKRSLDFVTAN